MEDEEKYIEAYDKFIYHFRKVCRINRGYNRKIKDIVNQYYPVGEVLEQIFKTGHKTS